jgi:type I restriction enzyme S subunit
MASYPKVLLRDICEAVEYGYTASSSTAPIGPRFLRITDIVPDRLDWDGVPFCAIDQKKIAKHRLRNGDIVIARTGATTGWAKYIANPPEAVFASYLVRIQPNESVDSRYVGFIVESQVYKDFIQQHMGGAAQPNANAQVLTSFEIPRPSLPIQRRIAGILSAYDDLIENSQRRIKILEEIARRLYREWFVHFRFPGHETCSFVESPLGEIPEGWEVRGLGDIAEEMRRNVVKGKLDEPRPYVGLEHIPRRSLALDNWDTTTDLGSNKLEFKKGEVLFGKIRPYFHKVSVAPFDGLCSADTIVIRPRGPEYYAFVVACVFSDEFVAHASASSNGSKMPRANWGVLKDRRVVIPKGKLAVKFSALVADIIAQQHALVFQVRNLRRTRDLLLPRLLSGQIDVEHCRSLQLTEP